MKFKQLVTTLCACGLGSVAFGGISITNNSIGVNFYTITAGDPAEPINAGPGVEEAGTNFSASSTAVVNRQDHWNDIGGGPQNASGSLQNVIDSTGTTVPVAVSWSGSDMAPIGWPGSGFDGNLLSGALLDLLGGPAELTFSNLPYARYNVIAYVDYENALQDTDVTILDGSGSTVLAGGVNVADGINGDASSFSFPGDYDDASLDGSGNFVIFEGLTNPNITVRSQNAGSVSYLSGVQIVQVPEPSLFAALLGMAALGGVALRRRS